jgi:hypothetical protein
MTRWHQLSNELVSARGAPIGGRDFEAKALGFVGRQWSVSFPEVLHECVTDIAGFSNEKPFTGIGETVDT